MVILGISCWYHDSAACLVVDGNLISAIEEEKFSRKKHDSAFPANAIRHVLNSYRIDINDVDFIVYYEKPFLKFERIFDSFIATWPKSFRLFSKYFITWVKEKLFLKQLLIKDFKILSGHKLSKDFEKRILFSSHHLSHAASAYYPSPFDSACVLVMDGVGERACTSIFNANGDLIQLMSEINYPHSLGLFYSAFTSFLGFKVNSGEYKVMGLAPYGEPIFVDILKNNFIYLNADFSYTLNLDMFDHFSREIMYSSEKFKEFFGSPRKSEEEITQFHCNLAASVQAVLEEAVLRLAKYGEQLTGSKNLCLAGGVALNCVANNKIITEKIFEGLWVQPASGDSGGALGAALAASHLHPFIIKQNRAYDSMRGALVGPSYSNDEIESELKSGNISYKILESDSLFSEVAQKISEGSVVGWFNGASEFGPRSLGNRAILADPRNPDMKKILNEKIKFREGFRPFAPAILDECYEEWFYRGAKDLYMVTTAYLRGEKFDERGSLVPAVTHVDGSCRVQSVSNDINPNFYGLIRNFYELTKIPMLINTSFNLRGEPTVLSPVDAIRCFLNSGIDILVFNGNYIIYKNQLENVKKERYEYAESLMVD
jgi:carbamoyltransferase